MDIKVSKDEWDKLPISEQERISRIMSDNFSSAKIVPDANGGMQAAQINFCELACDAAQSLAIAACGGSNTCVMIARAAGAACRSAC